jgi:hypothetical protein
MVAWKILVSVQPRAASPVTGSRQSGAVAGYSDLAPRLRRLSVGGRLRGCGCRKPWRAASTTRTRLTATHAAKAQHNVDHGPVLTGKGAGAGHPASRAWSGPTPNSAHYGCVQVICDAPGTHVAGAGHRAGSSCSEELCCWKSWQALPSTASYPLGQPQPWLRDCAPPLMAQATNADPGREASRLPKPDAT